MHSRRDSRDGLAKSNTEKLDKEDHEQVEPSTIQTCGSLSKPDRINHENPVSYSADGGERYL